MFKMIILLVFFSSYTLVSGKDNFGSIIEKCNKTFPIKHDILHLVEDDDKLFNVMKVEKNGKCFVHCILEKINLADTKGGLKKKSFFHGIKSAIKKVAPNEKKIREWALKLQKISQNFFDKCEKSDSVKKEANPCEKLFKFLACVSAVLEIRR